MLAALAAVVVLVAAGLLIWRTRDGNNRPEWQPPAQTFLPSLRQQPVPGWRARETDLGLPDNSTIAAHDDRFGAKPFIGYLGDRGYFIARSPGVASAQWWLVGVDVREGKPLFAPVPLNSAPRYPECFLNGPAAVLCVHTDASSGTAWVIDAQTGALSFTGPTELRLTPGRLNVTQVGEYAIAETMGEGVYGVGTKAEPTWFLPGEGSVSSVQLPNSDLAPQTLATETVGGPGSDRRVVFSVVDGSIVTAELDDDSRQETTVAYPGGFASELRTGNDTTDTLIRFFTVTGKPASPKAISGSLPRGAASLDLPVLHTDDWFVFSADGNPLAKTPPLGAPIYTRLIGDRLFVNDNVSPRWQQYDLRTGAQGNECELRLGTGYLGSDGSVAVFDVGNPDAGLAAVAKDLTTCETVWKIPSAANSSGRVWRANTTLVQLSDDATELFSLEAPG